MRIHFEWIQAKNNRPLATPGGNLGVLGVNNSEVCEMSPNGWTEWVQMWHTYAYSSANGHRLNKISSSWPLRHFWCKTWSKIQNLGNGDQTVRRIGRDLIGTRMLIYLVIYLAKTNWHIGIPGEHMLGLGRQPFKCMDAECLVHVAATCGQVPFHNKSHPSVNHEDSDTMQPVEFGSGSVVDNVPTWQTHFWMWNDGSTHRLGRLSALL